MTDATHHHWVSATVKITTQDGTPMHWSADCTCGLKEEGEGDLPLQYMGSWIIAPSSTIGAWLALPADMTKPVVRVFDRDGNVVAGGES